MNYRIVKTEPFQLFGIEGLISTVGDETYYASAGEMWNANHQSGLYENYLRTQVQCSFPFTIPCLPKLCAGSMEL